MLKGSNETGLVYEKRGHTNIVAYVDADYVGSPNDRISTSGYCVLIGSSLISWKSKKHNVVARSNAYAKYQAMDLTPCEPIWVKHLIQEFCEIGTMKLICDNHESFMTSPSI